MVIERARQVLRIEAEAVAGLIQKVDENFVKAVEILSECQGKVIVTGIGKSGIISQKIASTLACTGTPAFFLHPADGAHGDAGMMARKDVVVAVSNSGETNEIVQLLPMIKRLSIKLVVMTGNPASLLAHASCAWRSLAPLLIILHIHYAVSAVQARIVHAKLVGWQVHAAALARHIRVCSRGC